MNIPSFLVIIQNYKHGHYLSDLIEAIIFQSFRPVEVIVVDDASKLIYPTFFGGQKNDE